MTIVHTEDHSLHNIAAATSSCAVLVFIITSIMVVCTLYMYRIRIKYITKKFLKQEFEAEYLIHIGKGRFVN